MYRQLLQSGVQVKIVGDSISAGSGSSDDNRSGPVILTIDGKDYKEQLGKKCWASLFGSYVRGLYPASRVVNRSCSRLNSTELRRNIHQFVGERDRLILLMIGANDRKQENGRECLEENVKYLLDYFARKEKSVLLMSYPPSTEANESQPNRFFHMDEVDRILEEAAASRHVSFISHYKLLHKYYREQRVTVEEMMMAGGGKRDGLHPPDLVHHLIFEQIVRFVENEST